MSKENIKRKEGKVPATIVTNQIIIRPVDRSTKDIRSWRNAHQQAEQVVYANRVRLYDLYADIELDGHLTGITSKRIDAVLNKTIEFHKANKKVDEMDDLIESTVFRDIITEAMRSKYWGLSGLEFPPGAELNYNRIPRKHIKPDLKIIATEQSGDTGFSYEGVSNLWIIGDPDDLGLYLKCAPYALWKRGNMADWSQYVEIFGQPVVITKYDAYDVKTQMELTRVMDDAGSSLRLMIPKQADFEMVDGKQSNGDGKLQEGLKNACNDEMSVIILTNTETTTSSKSSGYAQSKEHGKQQLEVTKSDLAFVRNCLNSKQFLRILQSYGYPVDGGRFVYKKEINLDELTTRKAIDEFVSKKVPIGDDYYYETYDIPKPDNYEELKQKMEDEKVSNQNNDVEPGAAPGKKTATKKKKEDLNSKNLSWKDRFLLKLADFFDQAPND